MGRAFYPNEVDDPDLDWLVSNFLYERPDYLPVESNNLPLMLIPYTAVEPSRKEEAVLVHGADTEEPVA